MKIRTKLILLLSAALIVTMLVSTWLRIDWTRRRLEEQLKQSAQDTAVLIANELSQRLHLEMDQDEIGEQLKDEQRRHPGGDLACSSSSTPTRTRCRASRSAQSMEDAKVDKKPRPVPKKSPVQRREEARRAYYDHGESSRRPGTRMVEAMWRTPDKPDASDRWPPRAVQTPPRKPTITVEVKGTPGNFLVEAQARMSIRWGR